MFGRSILICLMLFQLAACTDSVPLESTAVFTEETNFSTETPTAPLQAAPTDQTIEQSETPVISFTPTLTPTLTASATISPTNPPELLVFNTWTPVPTVWKIESPFRERQVDAKGPCT